MNNDAKTDQEEGVTVELIEENTIGVITMYGVARSTVDEWIEVTQKLLSEWPKDKPYLVIHDVSDRRTSITPYMRARINDLYKMKLSQPGFMAIILPKSIASQIIQVFLRYLRTEPMIVQIFFSKEDAIAWLKRSATRQTS
jgi:hypothetical protein